MFFKRSVMGAAALCLFFCAAGFAHDTWVQTNANIVRVNDAVYVDLMLGNHGNEHRDFKLASKVKLQPSTLVVIDPEGKSTDLKPELTDRGLAETEGYWTARYRPTAPGLHLFAHTLDMVVSYAPQRAIKSAKTFIVASKSLDKVTEKNPGFDRVLGHALELVPQRNPVTPMGPGSPIQVQLLYKGKPLAGEKVAFIPRGVQLAEGADPKYERATDAWGFAQFEPGDANYYLIVAHHLEEADKGPGYESTKYGAALTVIVPAICPCCGD